MFWDDLVRRWRREEKVLSPQLLRGVGGHVAVLPEPRRRGRSRLLILLLVLLAIGALMLVGSGLVSGPDAAAETPVAASFVRAGESWFGDGSGL